MAEHDRRVTGFSYATPEEMAESDFHYDAGGSHVFDDGPFYAPIVEILRIERAFEVTFEPADFQ